MTHKFIILSSHKFSANRDEGATLMRPQRPARRAPKRRVHRRKLTLLQVVAARRLSNLSIPPGDACSSRWLRRFYERIYVCHVDTSYARKIMCVRGDINDQSLVRCKANAALRD